MPLLPNPLTPRGLPADVEFKPGDRRRLRIILLGIAMALGGCLILASGPSREANARRDAEEAAIDAARCRLSIADDGAPVAAQIEFTNTLDAQADYIVVDFAYLDPDGVAVHTGTVALEGLELNETGRAEATDVEGPPALATAVSCEVTSAFGI